MRGMGWVGSEFLQPRTGSIFDNSLYPKLEAYMSRQIEEAKRVSESLLDDLENSSTKIDIILMKAKRLARLMRDSDAQTWLDLEIKGYPDNFSFTMLGSCQKYAASGGRIDLEKLTYYKKSLPAFEADLESDEAFLNAFKSNATPTTKIKDFIEKNATEAFIATQLKIQAQQRASFANSKTFFSSLKASIHNYATDSHIALELGDFAENIFEGARVLVDNFIRSYCPQAAEKILAINDRVNEKSSESWSAALTSCRRLLMDVADSLFTAQNDDWIDRKGNPRKVGEEQYKNRILAFLSDLSESDGSYYLLESELEHLATKLDAIYEKTCKGVHIDVSPDEARLSVIHTYLFIGEIASISKNSQNKQPLRK